MVGAGIVAALHVGKMPAALPQLTAQFGLSLLQASTLLSVIQLATSSIGLFGGALTDRFGHVRAMVAGLCLLSLGSGLGALSQDPRALLASRVLESLGFIFTVLPGPTLLRQRIAGDRLSAWLGWWGAYMPFGMGMGLLLAAFLPGWRSAWWVACTLSALWALLVWRGVGTAAGQAGARVAAPMLANARQTLGSPGPWLLAAMFGFYAAQWMGVFGFLPTVYRDAGISPQWGGLLSAVGVIANAWGNIDAGRRAQRGVPAQGTLIGASAVMILTAWLIFAAPLQAWAAALGAGSAAGGLAFALRYLAVLVFSAVAGRIPGTLFQLSNRLAPGPQAVATTVGFMQQGAGLGQLLAPACIAWLATTTGGWGATGWLTGAWALVVMVAAWRIAGLRAPSAAR